MNGNTLVVPITDFIRKTKYYEDLFPGIGEITLTRDGRPYLDVRLNNQARNRKLLEFLDTIDPTLFANDEVWKTVAVRRNRKKPIRL